MQNNSRIEKTTWYITENELQQKPTRRDLAQCYRVLEDFRIFNVTIPELATRAMLRRWQADIIDRALA